MPDLHINFYENIKEANDRLNKTIIMYDGKPFYVIAITNHMKDNIFRVYMLPLGESLSKELSSSSLAAYPPGHATLGPTIDAWLLANPTSAIVRKHMNSPLFNKFRPFPLGMCNQEGETFYLERQPQRPSMNQGLTKGMIEETHISLTPLSQRDGGRDGPRYINTNGQAFVATIVGDYPSAAKCLDAFKKDEIANKAVAFNRTFALVKGPLNMLFLAYKQDIVGVLPQGDFSEVQINRDYKHCREAVEELKLFSKIVI